MASNPPRQCCTVGVLHQGEPQGTYATIGGVENYIAEPKSKDHSVAVLILTDVIGHKFPNVQLIADQFAANGYYTVTPDLFGGDPIPLNPPAGGIDIMKWLNEGRGGKSHLPKAVDPIVEAVIAELKEKHGVKKLGGVGYCFGGKYVARFLAKGKGLDVGYSAHPSFTDAEEVKGVAGPYSIAAAETDQIFGEDKRHETETILKEIGAKYQINLYSQTSHGFAVRGDISNPSIKYAKEAAFVQAVSWFDEYLKGERSWAA